MRSTKAALLEEEGVSVGVVAVLGEDAADGESGMPQAFALGHDRELAAETDAARKGLGLSAACAPNVVTALPENPVTNSLYYLTRDVFVTSPVAGAEYRAALKTPVFNGSIVNVINNDPSQWSTLFAGRATGFSFASASKLFAAITTRQEEAFAEVSGEADVFMLAWHSRAPIICAADDFEVNGEQYQGGVFYELNSNEGHFDGAIVPVDIADFAGSWAFSQGDIDKGFAAALFNVDSGEPAGELCYYDGAAWRMTAEASGLEARMDRMEAAQERDAAEMEGRLMRWMEEALEAACGGVGVQHLTLGADNPNATLLPGARYRIALMEGVTAAIVLEDTEASAAFAQAFGFVVDTPAGAPPQLALQTASGMPVLMPAGFAWRADKTYECSVLDGLALVAEWEAA